MPQELDEFTQRTACLATLVPNLDAWTQPPPSDLQHSIEDHLQDPKHLGWGPKTVDPSPDQVYPSDKLKEVVDIDPALEPAQREALFEVVRQNQAAFGFNSQLGHLSSKVHIELVPGTKPISMALYYASPAKREAIDKQIDLWLFQGVIEESKSPWGAPLIIIYCNGKPRVCIDWRKLNKVTVAGHPASPFGFPVLIGLRHTVRLHSDGIRQGIPAYYSHSHP